MSRKNEELRHLVCAVVRFSMCLTELPCKVHIDVQTGLGREGGDVLLFHGTSALVIRAHLSSHRRLLRVFLSASSRG